MTHYLSETACARCGCRMAHEFKCDCGAVHAHCCSNCGRFKSLSPTEYVDNLSPFVARCERGAVEHDHSVEKKDRFEHYVARLRARPRA